MSFSQKNIFEFVTTFFECWFNSILIQKMHFQQWWMDRKLYLSYIFSYYSKLYPVIECAYGFYSFFCNIFMIFMKKTSNTKKSNSLNCNTILKIKGKICTLCINNKVDVQYIDYRGFINRFKHKLFEKYHRNPIWPPPVSGVTRKCKLYNNCPECSIVYVLLTSSIA